MAHMFSRPQSSWSHGHLALSIVVNLREVVFSAVVLLDGAQAAVG